MLLDSLQVGSIKKAKTDAGFLIVKQVHMSDAKFVRGGLAKLPEISFRERHLMHVEEYGQCKIHQNTI